MPNAGPTACPREGTLRQLALIPIIHSPEDLGNLRAVVTTIKQEWFSEKIRDATAAAVTNFWTNLEAAIADWKTNWDGILVYQDALPFSDADNGSLIHLIVDELAGKGSHNHQILNWLSAQGARLQGTESPTLLLKEYDLIKRSLALELEGDAGEEQQRQIVEQQQNLLHERDRFIAERIDQTLPNAGEGLVFLGMLHSLEEQLPLDISVAYPFGRPDLHEHRTQNNVS